jgi:5-methylcytosine-specific restriction enzyme subunit McrC
MHIPIENIYFLLCYAWNKLDEKEYINISTEDATELVDLFAKILINATKVLLKRGLDHNYIEETNEVLGVKGKLLFSRTIKSGILQKQKTICIYDEFSPNILTNQILVTTIYQLIKTKGVDKGLKGELILLIRMFPCISRIKISSSLFKKIRLNRNNRFYGFILNVCQIIHESLLPTENEGEYVFSDFLRDENKMAYLFESFVRNFYSIEQSEYRVGRETIYWNFEEVRDGNKLYLPQMQTDITLESENSKIIIDAKYYKETLAQNYGQKKIHSTNLYQLFSYLMHQRDESVKTQTATGILLYPTIDEDYDLQYRYGTHNIQIRTVNLNSNWRNISNRLKEIINL